MFFNTHFEDALEHILEGEGVGMRRMRKTPEAGLERFMDIGAYLSLRQDFYWR